MGQHVVGVDFGDSLVDPGRWFGGRELSNSHENVQAHL
jgi:hypothetical protein